MKRREETKGEILFFLWGGGEKRREKKGREVRGLFFGCEEQHETAKE